MRYIMSDVSSQIIKACFDVHNELGPGYKERIYHTALEVALDDRGIKYVSEKEFYINYKQRQVGTHRLDLLIEDVIVVELKAIEGEISNLHITQTLSYMKAINKLIGLIINFGNKSVNIKRLYNKNFNKNKNKEIDYNILIGLTLTILYFKYF